ncbi:hypothetical protein [Heyndrickxia camelliae]|uniref:Uncharacterized protein n=1 Tax=Heyndrickxia camelliae TaxID=1707093 RepID=A0A2N3LEC3_9BACI|nr:hypothetical protein [Heyndrickxia camelliae]PKR82897.1 hypothetical protein CWO92_22160 [Heyndrickxia camelliae]
MTYRKPLCTCGSPLRIRERKESVIEYQITQDGREGRMTSEYYTDTLKSYLICPKCNKVFDKDEDEDLRIIRGNWRSNVDIT